MVKVKTFIQALSLFSSHPEKSKRFLDDKRLTQTEKNILRGYFLLRDSKFKETKELLDYISDITDPVVRSQFHLLSGIIYNNMNDFDAALVAINLSVKYLPPNQLPYFEFMAHLNLFIIHSNLRNVSGMKKELKLMKKYQLTDTQNVIRILSCEFLYLSFIEEHEEAIRVLDDLQGLKSQMTESDIVAHLIVEFEYSVKLKDLSRAKNVMNEMKENRKFSLSENYRFLKKMMDHYLDHKPLYFQDSEFEKQPVLLYHIKVIQMMEERKLAEAATWWSKLQVLYPESFKSRFVYAGPENLFSLCLELHQSAVTGLSVEIDETQGKAKAVIDYLEKSQGPVNREVLFKMLWGRDAQDKEDFIRLSRKMYRLKKQFNLAIEYRKGCYLLAPAPKKKAS